MFRKRPASRHHSCLRLASLFLVAFLGGCDYPRDAAGTLDAVRGRTLHVGAVNAPPWLDTSDGRPAGIEADLVRRIAGEFDATVEWHYGGFEQLRLLLEQRQLDLLVGGNDRRSAMRQQVGISRAYATFDWWVLGGTAPVDGNFDGAAVRVRHGSAVDMVNNAGGRPVLSGNDVPFEVVPVESGRQPPGGLWKLDSTEHVVLLPPGEHGWLVAVDRVIASRAQETATAR